MSDKMIEAGKDMYKNSGPDTKIIILTCIVIVFVVSVFAFLNYQNNLQDDKLIDNLTEMIKDQKQEDKIKRCVLEKWTISNEYMRNELFSFLGILLRNEGIVFPQELNDKIQKFTLLNDKIKDCLIIPED